MSRFCLCFRRFLWPCVSVDLRLSGLEVKQVFDPENPIEPGVAKRSHHRHASLDPTNNLAPIRVRTEKEAQKETQKETQKTPRNKHRNPKKQKTNREQKRNPKSNKEKKNEDPKNLKNKEMTNLIRSSPVFLPSTSPALVQASSQLGEVLHGHRNLLRWCADSARESCKQATQKSKFSKEW